MRQEIIDLYDQYTHYGLERRTFMQRLAGLAGGTAAAAAILPLLEANYARAAVIAEDDPRLVTSRVDMPATAGDLRAYMAKPADATGPLPGVIVVHENRGLNPHIADVTRRLALEGFVAVAPDFLSILGGTPVDSERARELIGQLDSDRVVSDARAAIDWLRERDDTTEAVGIMGFCWGGGVVGQVAVKEPELDAAVVFYGRVPPIEEVRNIKAAMLLNYAGLDDRINSQVPAFEDALKSAGVDYRLYMYEGVNHAFHNDTSEARYDPDAAKLAWQRTVEFLKNELVQTG